VDSSDRVEKFLARRGFSPSESAKLIDRDRSSALNVPAVETVTTKEPNAFERVIGTDDLMGVAFLEIGLKASTTVGRVWIGLAGGRPSGYGTGFLISPRLLITNHHVLGDSELARSSVVEFNYQAGADGKLEPTFTFALDPETFFFADEHLDYAVTAVQAQATSNGRSLSGFGFNPMIEEEGKVITSQFVNIIQHPDGGLKQLALRENQVIDILDDFLQYKTDTAPGSSGSPVYNDRWEVVGLHHSGVWKTNEAGQILARDGRVWREDMGEAQIDWIANEGVRISKIVAHLRAQEMTQSQRQLFEEMTRLAKDSGSVRISDIQEQSPPSSGGADQPQVQDTPDLMLGTAVTTSSEAELVLKPDGTVTWKIPLQHQQLLKGTTQPPNASTPLRPPDRPLTSDPPNENTILIAAQKELGKRQDVVAVKLGYVFENGWITKRRAIVVSVRKKQPPASLQVAKIDPLPEIFQGLPVEVVNPTVRELISSTQPSSTREAALSKNESISADEIKYSPPTDAPLSSR